MAPKTEKPQDMIATASGPALMGVDGGKPDAPLNVKAHAILNRYLDRALEFVLAKLGHGQTGEGEKTETEKTEKQDSVVDLRTVKVNVFAAPPTRNARGGKGVATIEAISPERKEAITKRGRRTFKGVGIKADAKTKVQTTEDGSWRLHVTTQKYASGADRDSSALKARDGRAVLRDIILGLLHVRQNITGRSGSWRKAAADIGFVQTPTGKYDKQGKPRHSWTKVGLTPALAEAINSMADALPTIPENLFMDYLTFERDPNAPKDLVEYKCNQTVTKATDDGEQQVACPFGKVALRKGRFDDLKTNYPEALERFTTCPLHNIKMDLQESDPAKIRAAAKRQREEHKAAGAEGAAAQ